MGETSMDSKEGVEQVLVRKRYPVVFCILFTSARRFVQTNAAWTGVVMGDFRRITFKFRKDVFTEETFMS